jgi:hypothetical protein
MILDIDNTHIFNALLLMLGKRKINALKLLKKGNATHAAAEKQ